MEKEPLILNGIKEKTYICQCGKSKNLPYCDETHKTLSENVSPAVLEPTDETLSICVCGKSKHLPYCDAVFIKHDKSWTPASSARGEGALYNGKEIAFTKQLSNRLEYEKGVAYLIKLIPPEGKMLRTVAVARSDEHVYILEGGFCDKSGRQESFPGDYILNPEGHPHINLNIVETIALVICTGATDEIKDFTVVDPKL